jgi:hypothetical protein
MNEDQTTPEVSATVEKPPRPVSRFTKRKSGGHKRPVRRVIGIPAVKGSPPAPQGERPDRSKPARTKYSDRNRISFDGLDPEYVYRAVNDTPGRIDKFKNMGYEFVESDKQLGDYRVAEGSKMGKAVSKPVGNGINCYLMRTKKEYYEEDQAEKAKRVDSIEAALKPAKTKEEYGPGLTNA